ncbi:MAG: excinuclease ABC subunit UvrC [Desulfobacterota bacterium]|nr:excinuclease ABC subunit UvrC [Thermodesulfobacteriota bacterium]
MALNELTTPQRRMALAHKAAQLPQTPGVYLMKDDRGSVLYVGKAKSLRHRVASYFQTTQHHSLKTQTLLSRIADFETIAAPTEKDALILENDLIKKYRPRFNVVFRDDKEYPYLRLSIQDPYPTLTIVRRPRSDGARYFGPFTSAQAVRETLKTMQRLFPLRTCSTLRMQQRRPCLYYQLGHCPAPCALPVDPDAYRHTVRAAELFLQGRNTLVVRELKKRMEEASRSLDFERAAALRDRITAIETTLQKQTLVCRDLRDRDIFALCRMADQLAVTILFIRASRVMGTRSVLLRKLPLSEPEALGSFLTQYYGHENYIPDEIILPVRFEALQTVAQWLREKKGAPVALVCPQRGFRKTLLAMAAENAQLFVQHQQDVTRSRAAQLDEIYRRLKLPKLPERIACVDISTIGGTAAAGAVVVFHNAEPDTGSYRRYHIASVHQQDDYAMMHEVLTRFLSRTQKENTLPDLMIVDGGKGQLAILTRVLQELKITSVAPAALAKGRGRQVPGQPHRDHVFIPGRKNPIVLPLHSPALLLLQRIRDEAHRFAVAYHARLRANRAMSSPLQHIPGIGQKLARRLLQYFGDLVTLRHASREQLRQVPGMTERRVDAVVQALTTLVPDTTSS